jgi:L-alanine-DL-glutamate epimerase-like enolase superfamily enzyme
MNIANVEAFVLASGFENAAPVGSEEARGVKHCLLIKVTTDDGLIGWSDIETAPHVSATAVSVPASGIGMFEGLRQLVVGEDPFDVERLWDKVYRGTAYYGRRGVAIQLLSGFDIACHDIMGKAVGRPVHKLLGGARCDRIRAYASTLFRSTPEAMKEACAFYLERGFTVARRIAWEAEIAGCDVCPHAWLTDLLTAASLHFNAVLPRSLFLEYNVCDSPMLREVIANPLVLEADGTIAVPQGPGLGIEINEAAVQQFCVHKV